MVTNSVDIIIPVYNAPQQVEDCVNSVLHNTDTDFHLIIIDDASPDSRIGAYLAKLEKIADQRIQVSRNQKNLGFIGTVNRGMSMNNRDVVLLNSDTLVTPGWLQKLQHCAATDSRIGTITPFSNNAEICSFPLFCQSNPVPENPNLVAQAIAVQHPTYPEIPTAVGFCMYITRNLLNDIGLFNEQAFGRGYGEENDFCRRAVNAQYRNVLCDDAYVVHVGSCSFGDEKQAHCERNMQVLLDLHPDYMDIVSEFITRDPIKPIRKAAQTRLEQLIAQTEKTQHQQNFSNQGIAMKFWAQLRQLFHG
jgi:GT2 family glycosyltransferase